jgi:signal transduction histidine kinase
VRVTDSGPGIPEDQREKIFDLFHQAGSATDRAKGVGIGLALARRFAQALGGHVGVDSTVGVGTTFTLRLPAARRSAAA